jgi:transcriptional regulator with XRE-family HTH domain
MATAENDPDLTGLSASELAGLVGVSERLDSKIAQHDRVSSPTLAKLAQSRSAAVLRNVVLNPACPKEVLLKLAPKFPNEFFANPAILLQLLVDPDLFLRLPITAIKAILKSPDCPPSMIDWAMRSGGSSHALALAARADISPELLRQIARGPHVKASELAISRLMGMGEPISEKVV